MRIKYIIIRQGNLEIPHLFPAIQTHLDVAKAFSSDGKIISAGFCDYYGDVYSSKFRWTCYGESHSLGIKSRKYIDDVILTSMFT